MIIGNGLIAKAFSEDYAETRDLVLFASGVSNSNERNAAAFMRERTLLEKALSNGQKLVYFSTCSVYDPDLTHSPYVLHKRAMEELVRKSSSHAIFRLPQVVGNTPNPNILVNFLFQKIMSNEHFKVWRHAYRNIIDIEDVRAIAKILIDDGSQARQTSNIACPISMSVIDLVEVFEKVLGRAAEYSLVEAGAFYEIDTTRAEQVAEKAGVRFDDDYVERVVRKYYAQ